MHRALNITWLKVNTWHVACQWQCELDAVTSKKMYHDWWPYKWTSCWACVVRNQNYITATFWESIVQYLSVFNVKYTPTVHGKCINFSLLKGGSSNNHPYPFQIKVLSVSGKIGTITKENHCILIDISCVNIFKSNIYIPTVHCKCTNFDS